MAATSHSQHRCVFVGNIPYDATEEQLIQICEEVGPVVSFRLVIDRETGKPKGYGFCEYKDEETALSARRNLQGYEINGRQLRVDFAENDKNSDRSRTQGHGGLGMVPNIDPHKQIGGPAVLGDPSFHQPLGISVAMAAATVMAGSLGGGQAASSINPGGLQIPMLGTDPLTPHLAKMSRSQLTEIMSELKGMATLNKEQARQLLLTTPNLSKALFQAQIMLGMVSPQMLQTPNIRQGSVQPVLQFPGQQTAAQALPGLPPLPQNRTQGAPDHPSPLMHNVYGSQTQFTAQSQTQLPQLAKNQILQQSQLPGQPVSQALLSLRAQSLGTLSARPPNQVVGSSSLNQQLQPPVFQQSARAPPTSSTYNNQMIAPNAGLQPSSQAHLPFSAQGFQPISSALSGIQDNVDLKRHAPGISDKVRMLNEGIDQINRPSKTVKLNDGRGTYSPEEANIRTSVSGSTQTFDISRRQISSSEEAANSDKPVMQIPSDVESALLQQVLNLTPEQLSSLPPDQQEQVIQLQQMLRQAT